MIFNLGAGGASNAQAVQYDNSNSGLEATNVQGAVDELNNSLANGNVKFKVENGELYYSVYTE